ncbi:MAG: KEOPS complex subunit Pcc1 [Candidatus Geothermarchaeales archaeon]
MKRVNAPYSLTLELGFPSKDIAEVVYSSIHPDVAHEGGRGLQIALTLKGFSILCAISSSSYAKFRGFITSFLRLIFVSSKILGVVNQDDP